MKLHELFQKWKKKGNKKSILKGFYMDYVNPLETKYDFLFHNVFLQCFYNFET
jgi:hypothetical protein